MIRIEYCDLTEPGAQVVDVYEAGERKMCLSRDELIELYESLKGALDEFAPYVL